MRRLSERVRALSLGGVATALIVVLLSLCALFPTLDLSLAAIAALFVYVVLLETRRGVAFLVFLASSVLSLLLLPSKTAAIFFVLFFGWYPFLRAALARLSLVLGWVVKAVCAVSVLGALYALVAFSFLPQEFLSAFTVPMLLLLGAVFVLYEIGLGRLVLLYLRVLRPRLFRK